jgi:mlo protein
VISTKLEHIITTMAVRIVNSSTVVTGIPNVMLTDELFWFKRPKLIIKCIHFVLFQVSNLDKVIE